MSPTHLNGLLLGIGIILYGTGKDERGLVGMGGKTPLLQL